MIGSLDDMDGVEEGALERIRANKLVKDATSLILDCVDQVVKARQRQFSTRSEAGAYAARIRWGNRNQAADPMDELRTASTAVQQQLGAITWDVLEEASDWRNMEAAGPSTIDGTDSWLVRLNKTSPDAGDVMVGTKAINLEKSITDLGAKAYAIADKRLADRGVTRELVDDARRAKRTELDGLRAQHDELKRTHPGSKYNRYDLGYKVRRGQMTPEERTAAIKDYNTQAAAIKKRHVAVRQQLDTPDYNFEAARSAEVKSVLAEVRGTGTAPQFKSVATAASASKGVKPASEAIASMFPSSHVQSMNAEAGLSLKVVRQGVGGSYNHEDKTIRLELSKETSRYIGAGDLNRAYGSVAVHEYAHASSFHRPGVMIAEQAFYQRRTRGIETHEGPVASTMAGTRREPAVQMGSVVMTVDVRPDNFVRPYVGRDYSRLVESLAFKDPSSRLMGTKRFHPTETFSEGVEALSGFNTKTIFADQDHKNFALGVLLGLP